MLKARLPHLATLGFLASLLAPFDSSASTAVLVSVPDQKLTLLRDGKRVATYKISTSRFGIGDKPGTYATPLGKLEVAARIGEGLAPGAVMKGRHATGEVLPVNAKGRDPIVTRILHLRGLEPGNANAYDRAIYIHGTPAERTIGKPESYGCVRMKSKDIVELFEQVPVGTRVEILNEPTRRIITAALASTVDAPAKNVASVEPAPARGATALATVAAAMPSLGAKSAMNLGPISELPSLGATPARAVR